MSESEKVRREVARVKMPLPMSVLGRLLSCFSDEFVGSYAQFTGDYLVIYVDVEEGDL